MLWIAGAVTSALEWTRIVWPSGSALATALTPIAPPPPGLLPMMMGCPTLAETSSNTVRGKRSVALPGENGTITCPRLVGHACACAGVAAATAMIKPAASADAARRHALPHELDI